MPAEQLTVKYADIIEEYLQENDYLLMLILDDKFAVKDYNEAFIRLLRPKETLKGRFIMELLADKKLLPFEFSDSESVKKLKLNFISADAIPVTIHCRIYKTTDEYIIFGGHSAVANVQLLQKMSTITNELANISRDLQRKNRALEEAYDKIKVLSGIVPICMHCKEIRDDKGYWNKLEEFITDHSEAQFSHSICPACIKKHYPDFADED